ncbi:peptidase [Alkalihalobacterium alkalinitrilicum]|uniref:peptidase n=1 Tax=Alkalihalobacterium alkalinitrilicum TaxID=427920 RepID=UPI0009955FCC|nr:peptidase [Alkalihalobacterium alkalinitrilicum]
MKLSLQSQIKLFPLNIRKDQKHYIVEEINSGDFFEMPKMGVDAIRLIEKGESLEKIDLELKIKYPDSPVDLVDFAQQLLELELIQEVDGETVHIKTKDKVEREYKWIKPLVGRFFFNRLTNKIYMVLVVANILFLIMNPQLFPTYRDLFLFDAIMANILIWMGISLILVLFHELGHILAVRSYDLPAKLGIGNRLFLVVFETDLSNAWKLPSKQRNVLFFAGICFDQLMLFIVFCLQFFFQFSHPLILGILGLIVLDIFIRTIYQCCFYMKTDLYYYFENITGCYNLMENSMQYLSKWVPFIKKDSSTEAFDGEEKFVKIYSLFCVVGITLTFSVFIFYFMPQAFYAYSKALPELFQPNNNPYFWDALVFIGQSLLIAGLLLYSLIKKRKIGE